MKLLCAAILLTITGCETGGLLVAEHKDAGACDMLDGGGGEGGTDCDDAGE